MRNATLKNNILFGKKMKQDVYDKVSTSVAFQRIETRYGSVMLARKMRNIPLQPLYLCRYL
jgi:hypothetical protein